MKTKYNQYDEVSIKKVKICCDITPKRRNFAKNKEVFVKNEEIQRKTQLKINFSHAKKS